MCATCVSGVRGSQKKAEDSQELAIWTVVSHPVKAEDRTWVLYKNNILLTADLTAAALQLFTLWRRKAKLG